MSRSLFPGFAALGVFSALVFVAAAARADICADLFDECEIPNGVFEWNIEQLGGYFPLDDGACAKMADAVFKQCEKNVSAAAKCWIDVANTLPKTAKSACKEQGDLASRCNADFKSDAQNDVEDVESYADSELGCCDLVAEDFEFFCIEGF